MDAYEQEQADKTAHERWERNERALTELIGPPGSVRRIDLADDVRHVDEDGRGWREIPGEPGSFEIVDTSKQPNEGGEMSGTTLTKEAQASGKSRAGSGAEQDTKAEAPKATKAKVKVRPIPDDYIKEVVKRVKKGEKYSDIEKAMIEAGTAIPEGYKTHYPAIRSAAIRKFGSVAEARAAAGKKNS